MKFSKRLEEWKKELALIILECLDKERRWNELACMVVDRVREHNLEVYPLKNRQEIEIPRREGRTPRDYLYVLDYLEERGAVRCFEMSIGNCKGTLATLKRGENYELVREELRVA